LYQSSSGAVVTQPWAIAIFDIDGVVRDVSQSYRRAIADTVEHFTQGAFRPNLVDIDALKREGCWNNDWLASQELIRRHGPQGFGEQPDYDLIVDFFQRRYRGNRLEDPNQWDGYITHEPLLMSPNYLSSLTGAGIAWGFFSGATPGSARYVLERRLGLRQPCLVAMGDAPDKPDPTGLFQVLAQLDRGSDLPVAYVGDTVADIQTLLRARQQLPQRQWFAVGIVPPHALERQAEYTQDLLAAGADTVLTCVNQLSAEHLQALVGQLAAHGSS
jgi:HAD superfamily phosphatase